MTAGKLNKRWHESHVMPKNPTRVQRVEWHAKHAEACGCREVPADLVAEVEPLRKKARAN